MNLSAKLARSQAHSVGSFLVTPPEITSEKAYALATKHPSQLHNSGISIWEEFEHADSSELSRFISDEQRSSQQLLERYGEHLKRGLLVYLVFRPETCFVSLDPDTLATVGMNTSKVFTIKNIAYSFNIDLSQWESECGKTLQFCPTTGLPITNQ